MLSGVPTMAKVVPIFQNNSGTFVHHIAEVKDYIVTPSGDWIEAAEPAETSSESSSLFIAPKRAK
jgi:hypothetical protein